MNYRHIKRALGALLSLCALVVCIVIFPIIAVAIKLDDGGPVIYKAQRRGYGGQPFTMYKFRSMVVNAPDIRQVDHSTFNSPHDARLTRTGRLLRKTSLDELPQFFNVLKGDMALVGPRPHMAGRPYDSLSDDEKKCLTVKPGITGYSQSLHRNAISAADKCSLDCYYIDHLNLGMDVTILCRTVSMLARKEAVYTVTSQPSPASPLFVPSK